MARVTPTTKLDVAGNLDPIPEKTVGEYIESKQGTKYSM